ncbi:MAG: TetR family transcriptional regulator C-terminal domain-containing protein [Rhizobiales bacterium]|nr:TetR family transcriptional regulator C-terminal domain-containing protein [Hyphomicrobiales bacterium]
MTNKQIITKQTNKTSSSKASIRAENEQLILRAAEQVFAEYGFRGATTKMIADLAGIPKANLHYYFPTKNALYSKIVEDIFAIWLDAADTFDDSTNPIVALSSYIDKKMEISRKFPNSSKVWANEVMHGAPIIQDYLETHLREWTKSREEYIQGWIDAGLIDPIEPKHLLYMIWATTQHYADFAHQIETLNNGKSFNDKQWANACRDVKKIILDGVGARAVSPRQFGKHLEVKTRIQLKKTEQIQY